MSQDLFSYPFEKKAQLILEKALGPDAKFKENQLEAILSVVKDRRKLLLVERTGWGKSMVYFIASKIMRDPDYYDQHLNQPDFIPGPALLISPLLALMRNQILSSNEIIRMDTINSAQTQKENEEAQTRFLSNELDMLIISPERLSNRDFTEQCLAPMANKIPLMIVDEAHCISDWGHDFRPDYKRIKNIISNLPNETPLLATTATANERVVMDLHKELDANIKVQRGQLTRSTINLRVKKALSVEERLCILETDIRRMKAEGMKYAGIIYTLTVRDSIKVASWLRENGILAHPYYGSLHPKEEKIKLENQLINNEIDVLVATNALSMGFDKSDLGFVYHYQTPRSVIHYYQQVGRAGRAIDEAFGTCLLGEEDKDINNFFIDDAFPKIKDLNEIINFLDNHGESSFEEMTDFLNINKSRLEKCLKFLATLENPPILETKKPSKKNGNRPIRHWIRTPNPLQIDEEKISTITRLRKKEWEEMNLYLEEEECLTKFLSRSLGDAEVEECGNCSFCLDDDLKPSFAISDESRKRAKAFLKSLEIPITPRKRWEKPPFKYWPQFHGSIKPHHIAEEGKALCQYTDSMYGPKIKEGKDNGFDEILLEESLKLIRGWSEVFQSKNLVIVPVPSRNSQSLSLFCKNLSVSLGYPFEECLEKIRENKQQKLMENTQYQKRNIDGVFSVKNSTNLNDTVVLLIDDIVKSKWTFTVCSALLREHGIKKVYPFALANIDSGAFRD